MSLDVAALESLLCAGYREEEALYAQALVLAEQHAEERWVGTILELFERVADVERRLAPVRDQLPVASPRGPALGACLDRVAGLIRALQEKVDRATQRIEQRRQALQPELDGLVRLQRMRQAYGRVLPSPGRGEGVLS